MAALLALTSSLLWGTADFLGGTLSRRVAPVAVVGASQAIAWAGLLPVVLLLGAADDPTGYLWWGIAAGVTGLIALIAFYAALAVGTMGVVAPVAATGVVVPVAIGLAAGERPSTLTLLGIVLAVAGVVLASGPEVRGIESGSARGGWRALVLALIAAVGFGLVLVFVAEGAEASVGMTLLTQRSTSVLIMLAAFLTLRRVGGLRRADVPALVAIGLFDLGANATFALASTAGLLAVVAVPASLYPVVTVALARVFHNERLLRVQQVGVAAALVGIGMIAAGGA